MLCHAVLHRVPAIHPYHRHTSISFLSTVASACFSTPALARPLTAPSPLRTPNTTDPRAQEVYRGEDLWDADF
jgi:hypothetical protein